MDVWFNNTSTGYIGVIEYKGDRTLVHDTDTIADIQKHVKWFMDRLV